MYKDKMRVNMSGGGSPYDNSCVERIFAQPKKERIYCGKYRDLSKINDDRFDYIVIFTIASESTRCSITKHQSDTDEVMCLPFIQVRCYYR
jgi:transposase InsO family protein